MTEDKDTRTQVEEDAQEDIELTDEDAGKVAGGRRRPRTAASTLASISSTTSRETRRVEMTEDTDRTQAEEDAQEDLELTDEAADKVAGGKLPMSELNIKKVVDKTSTTL